MCVHGETTFGLDVFADFVCDGGVEALLEALLVGHLILHVSPERVSKVGRVSAERTHLVKTCGILI